MRKIFIFLLLLIQFGLFAKDKYTIGFSQCGKRDNWRLKIESEMETELLFHPDLSIIIKQSLEDSRNQVKQIDELINEGVDLLIVSPNEIEPIQQALEKIYEKGIPVILVDRNIQSNKYTAYIGGSNYEIGQFAGEYIARNLNYTGNVLEIQGTQTTSPAIDRSKGFNDALKKYPQIKNVYKIQSIGAGGNTVFDSLPSGYKQHPDIKAIFAFNDDIAFDAYNILKDHITSNHIMLVGVDGLPNPGGGIELVEKGILSATIIYPTGGKEAIQIASKILHGEAFDKINLLPNTLVDKSNVKITRHQLQNISDLRTDIEKSINMLKLLNGKYHLLQVLLTILAILFIVLIILFILYLNVNRKLKLSNHNLEDQKNEISNQNIELQRLDDELKKVTQEKLRFFTNISHEFRTPLTLISGPVDKLIKSDNLTFDQHDLLKIAKKNITILLKLIEQIIEFRKYENGFYDFKPVSADLLSDIKHWDELFTEAIRLKKITFNLEYNESLSYVMNYDIEKMERIYTNLLSNAFKYTPEGGVIRVTLEIKSDLINPKIEVTVKNTGKPISDTDITNLFNRFYQIETKKGSSGIGLALVKAYIEMHNGNVQVENEQGFITFRFTIPMNNPISEIAKADDEVVNYEKYWKEYSSEEVQSELQDELFSEVFEDEDPYIFDNQIDDNSTTMLVVDDNSDIRAYLKKMFEENYNVIEARNGIEAIRKAIKHVPDIIISDIMMPGIDGILMCKHLKNEISTSHIPVILLTANTLDEKRLSGYENGADAFFSKPINFEMLEVRVRKLIEGRKQLRELFGSENKNNDRLKSLNKTDKSFIEIFEDEMEKNIDNQDLNVDYLSNKLGLSRTQLFRKVKAVTNYTPIEYLIVFRLKKAIHLMTVTELSVKEIAYQVGFSAPSYFSTSFKKYYNTNPTEYMKNIRNN